jgi:hypothetical protein
MSQILDRVAGSLGPFTPTSPTEYLAFQIAQKLGDIRVVRHYLVLFEHYPEELLVNIFHQCKNEQNMTGERFMQLLRERTQ